MPSLPSRLRSAAMRYPENMPAIELETLKMEARFANSSLRSVKGEEKGISVSDCILSGKTE
jgi:hypothetical protein